MYQDTSGKGKLPLINKELHKASIEITPTATITVEHCQEIQFAQWPNKIIHLYGLGIRAKVEIIRAEMILEAKYLASIRNIPALRAFCICAAQFLEWTKQTPAYNHTIVGSVARVYQITGECISKTNRQSKEEALEYLTKAEELFDSVHTVKDLHKNINQSGTALLPPNNK